MDFCDRSLRNEDYMRYIDSLHEGERVTSIYMCKQKNAATTKNGKPYENVLLQDRTGTLDAKIWEPNSMGIEEFEALDFVEVQGEITVFNGAMQMSIKRVRKCAEGEFYMKDFLPVSSRDIGEMYAELMTLKNKVENTYLRRLLDSFFVDDTELIKNFKLHSAAKSVHHGFVGGLLEHTLGVTNLCDCFADRYPMLNRDLLITGAMLHDIGKLKELSDFPSNDYTDDGQLLGHIIIGVEMIGKSADKIEGFPAKLEAELKHLIVSHHGEYEYGSPKKPAIMEAFALNFADNMDAKMETLKELLSTPQAQTGEWLGFQKMLDTNVRKTLV